MDKIEDIKVMKKVTFRVISAIISLFIISGLMSYVLWTMMPVYIVIILSVTLMYFLLNLANDVKIKHQSEV